MAKLNAVTVQYQQQVEQLAQLTENQNQQKQILELSKIKQQQTLSALNKKAYTGQQKLAKLEREESALVALLKRMAAAARAAENQVGLSKLKPDSILHLLFQMSESTANPDLDKAELDWYYLRDNEWKLLRKDFEVLQDDTDGLLRSGIVTLAIPRDINQNNTVLSSTHHWIKVATAKNSASLYPP